MFIRTLQRVSTVLVLALPASLFLVPATLCTQENAPADGAKAPTDYADHIRATYSYPFGEGNLSAPGNAADEGNDFLSPKVFMSADYCGHCHQEADQ